MFYKQPWRYQPVFLGMLVMWISQLEKNSDQSKSIFQDPRSKISGQKLYTTISRSKSNIQCTKVVHLIGFIDAI